MPAPDGQNCGNCYSCVQVTDQDAECHNQAARLPQAGVAMGTPGSRWAPVNFSEWCRQWEAIPS